MMHCYEKLYFTSGSRNINHQKAIMSAHDDEKLAKRLYELEIEEDKRRREVQRREDEEIARSLWIRIDEIIYYIVVIMTFLLFSCDVIVIFVALTNFY